MSLETTGIVQKVERNNGYEIVINGKRYITFDYDLYIRAEQLLAEKKSVIVEYDNSRFSPQAPRELLDIKC